MAVVTISTASGFDFDDLDFPDLTTGTTATKTATTWRVSQTPATTFDEYTGKALTYFATGGGGFVPNGGTITGFKHVENGVTQFQATKLSISGAAYKTLFDGDDFTAFVSNVLGGNDTITGGAGIDRADYRWADGEVNVDLNLGIASDDGHGTIDALIAIENVRGGDFDDRITGNAGANLLEGGEGADVLTGAGGNDTLNGAEGVDTFRFNGFGEGHDVIQDWNGAEDILSFSDLLDTGAPGILDDLQAAIADIDDNVLGGDVVVTFNNGSTLTFQGAGTGAITDIAQLVTDPNTQITTF